MGQTHLRGRIGCLPAESAVYSPHRGWPTVPILMEGAVTDEQDRLDKLLESEESRDAQERDPKETFQQISHIAISMSFDLIDKLRFFEKETLKLSEEEIEKRTSHLAGCLDSLRAAYLEFSEIDF